MKKAERKNANSPSKIFQPPVRQDHQRGEEQPAVRDRRSRVDGGISPELSVTSAISHASFALAHSLSPFTLPPAFTLDSPYRNPPLRILNAAADENVSHAANRPFLGARLPVETNDEPRLPRRPPLPPGAACNRRRLPSAPANPRYSHEIYQELANPHSASARREPTDTRRTRVHGAQADARADLRFTSRLDKNGDFPSDVEKSAVFAPGGSYITRASGLAPPNAPLN